jgi:hypothetical protein
MHPSLTSHIKCLLFSENRLELHLKSQVSCHDVDKVPVCHTVLTYSDRLSLDACLFLLHSALY